MISRYQGSSDQDTVNFKGNVLQDLIDSRYEDKLRMLATRLRPRVSHATFIPSHPTLSLPH